MKTPYKPFALALSVLLIGFGAAGPALGGGKHKVMTELAGRTVEYEIGEYHLRVKFIGENQLKWT